MKILVFDGIDINSAFLNFFYQNLPLNWVAPNEHFDQVAWKDFVEKLMMTHCQVSGTICNIPSAQQKMILCFSRPPKLNVILLNLLKKSFIPTVYDSTLSRVIVARRNLKDKCFLLAQKDTEPGIWDVGVDYQVGINHLCLNICYKANFQGVSKPTICTM